MTNVEVEVDAWGTEGVPYDCQDCYGSGTTYGERCCTCGGLGFLCEEVSAD